MKIFHFILISLLLTSCSNLKDSSTSDQPLKNHSVVNLFDFSLKDVTNVYAIYKPMSSGVVKLDDKLVEKFYNCLTKEDYVVCQKKENSFCPKMKNISLEDEQFIYEIVCKRYKNGREVNSHYYMAYKEGYFIVEEFSEYYHNKEYIELDEELKKENIYYWCEL